MQPAMKPAELDLFEKLLSRATRYVESGCGGTTVRALEANVTSIDCVETDVAWIERLRERPDIAQAVEKGRLRFHQRDVGEVIQWGIPVDHSKLRNWPYYSLGFWREIEEAPDFVFVDGRFRVATTIAALVYAAPDASVMLHDFAGRDHYEAVLALGDVTHRIDTAIVLRRKKGLTDADLMLEWSHFMFDAR